MMSQFAYKSLNTSQSEIRLILLQPSEGYNHPIECQLVSTNLDDEPIFEALSYEWGSPSSSNASTWIQLNGHRCHVRRNLLKALAHLRRENEQRTLWVDALCINQEDIGERNHQVAQMGRIYTQASRVVAWLGWTGPVETVELLQSVDATKQQKHIAVEPSAEHQNSLLELCSLSYWERLWIIQELVLAKTVCVQYGDLTFDLNLFGNIERSLLHALDYRQRLKILNSLPLKIVKLLQERQDRGQGDEEVGSDTEVDLIRSRTERPEETDLYDERVTTLLDVMYEASLSKCMDMRDKVFGLVNLGQQCCRQAIRPDYSMSLENICQNILSHHLSKHSDKRRKPTGSGSPVLIVRKILESFGLNFTKGLRDQYRLAHEPISCQSAMNRNLCPMSIKLYNVPSIVQKIMWVSSLPRVDLETGELLMDTPPMPGEHYLKLREVLKAAKNGTLKPRFIAGEPLEGDELYFKPDQDFIASLGNSKTPSHATIPLGSIFNARNTLNGAAREQSAANLTTLDANGNPVNEVYLRRSMWSQEKQKQPADKGQPSSIPEGQYQFHTEMWINFIKARMKTLAMQQLKMFVTDQGEIGYATQNCELGDLICEISDGNQKVAIFKRSYKVSELSRHNLIGKGILLRQNSELAGREKKIELMNKGLNDLLWDNFTETNCTMHLDFASLLYVSGYF